MTKYACDLCKSDLPEKVEPVKIRIGSNMHDFCDKCHTTLLKMLEGTGTGVVEQNLSELMGQYTYPSTPTYVPNKGIGLNPGISWKDGNIGLNDGSLQVTYGTSMSNAGPLTDTIVTSGFITQANNSSFGLNDVTSKGIFSAFTEDAVYDTLKTMMATQTTPISLIPMKGV
jgi:hypothetical protein